MIPVEAFKEQTQKLFDRFAHELITEGKTTLVDYPSFVDVIFKYDPFNRKHVEAKTFILVDLKLLPAHLYTIDSRRHILIDLQEISKLAPSYWPERLKDLAREYGIIYKGYWV